MTTQTKTTYSQGPWELLHHTAPQHDGDRAVYGPGNKLICDMDGGPNDDSETLANARLIASAPELLEALKRVRYAFYVDGTSKALRVAFEGTKEIVAKAEGRGE